jgi:integrase
MTGHIRKRGRASWELKFEGERDPATGARKIHYHSFRDTKRDAQLELAELITAVSKGTHVEPTRVIVAD